MRVVVSIDHPQPHSGGPVDICELIEPPIVQRRVTGRTQDPLVGPEPEITELHHTTTAELHGKVGKGPQPVTVGMSMIVADQRLAAPLDS